MLTINCFQGVKDDDKLQIDVKIRTGEACWDTQLFHPILPERPFNIKGLEFLTVSELFREWSVHPGIS